MNLLKEIENDRNMGYQKRNKNKLTLIGEYNASIIKKGKKFKSEQAVLNICRALKKNNSNKFFYSMLAQATDEVKPYIGLLSKKVGSTTYRIPVSLTHQKEILKGIMWLTREPCGRKQGNFEANLLGELNSLLRKEGASKSLKKKIALHKLAENNRMFIKFLTQ